MPPAEVRPHVQLVEERTGPSYQTFGRRVDERDAARRSPASSATVDVPPRSARRRATSTATPRRGVELRVEVVQQRRRDLGAVRYRDARHGDAALLVARPRELRREHAVPHAVGHQRALADEQARRRRDAVADLRRLAP